MAVQIDLWPQLLSSIFILFSIERLMNLFLGKRKSSLLLLLASLLLCNVASGVVFLFFNIPLLTIAINLITIFIVSLNYEAALVRKIAGTIGSFFILTAVGMSALVLNQNQLSFVEGVEYISAVIAISTGVSAYLIALLLNNFKNIKEFHVVPIHVFLISMVIPISSFLLTFLISNHFPLHSASIAIAILFIINLTFYYYQDTLAVSYQDKLKLAIDSQEKDFYLAQCQLMQESVEQAKSMRHDIKLHLSTVKGYSSKIKADEITDYVSSLLGDIGESEIYSDTGNIAFDSIINFKLKNAVDEDIKLDIKVLVPPALNIEVADVVTILGNLLDNALNAVEKAEDKRIKLNVKATKGNIFIAIENTFDGKVKYANGKDGITKVIVTRKDNSKHGYGLSNIRKSIEKYNGHIDVSHEGNVFSVGVLLYVDDV